MSSVFFELLLNGIGATLILALAALGLAIIFGFMDVINLAHGAFFTLGAYCVWAFYTELGISFWIAIPLAAVVVAATGVLVEYLIVRFLYQRLLDTILATWGVAIVLTESIKVAVGPSAKRVDNPLSGSVDLGVTVYPTYRLFLILFSIGILLIIFGLFYRTQFGVRLRAVIQDEESASLLGINQERMYQFSFALGSGLAGLAGAAMSPVLSVNPEMGTTYLVQSFLVIILGGIGSLIGVVPGSIVIGGTTNILTYFIQPVVAQTLVFIIAILALVIWSEGILEGVLR